MANLTDLYDDVMPELPGCTLPVALHAIRRAAREFFMRSKIDRRDLPVFNTVANDATYILAAPSDTEIQEVLQVKYSGETLDPLTLDQLPDQDMPGIPTNYAVDQEDMVTLTPIPNGVAQVLVKVCVVPTMTAATISDTMMADWGDAIASGAKARLMNMSKKAWTNEAAAAKHEKAFESAIDTASVAAVVGKSRAPIRTRPATIMGR